MARYTMSAELETLAIEAVYYLQYRTAKAAHMIMESLGVTEDVARKAIDTVARPSKNK